MANRNRRRLLLGGAAVLPVLAFGAAKLPRIGVLLAGPADGDESRRFLQEFREGLLELGRARGRDYALAVRSYGNEPSRIAAAAARLDAERCQVVVSETSAGAAALHAKAPGVPIVVAAALDPLGGQVTGIRRFDSRQDAKLAQLAHELFPRAARLCFVCTPAQRLEDPESVRLELGGAAEMPRLAERLAALQADALVIAADPRLFALRDPIVRASLAVGVPAFGPAGEFADLGALASFGCDLGGSFRAAARYVDRILKGASPSELPVETPSRFELVLNLKTARALHLELPSEALLRADRVIE